MRFCVSPVTHIGPMRFTGIKGPVVCQDSDAAVLTTAPDTGIPAVVLGLLVVRSKRVEPRGVGEVVLALT